MEVNVVHKTEYKPKTVSYFNALAIGALSGYALKYLCPVTKHEKEGGYKPSISDIQKQAREAKLAEIETIRKADKKAAGADVFLKLVDEKDFATRKKTFSELEKPVKEQVLGFMRQVNKKSREVNKTCRELSQEFSTAWLKHIRPTGAFVLTGVGVALIGSLIYNVIQRTSASAD